LLGKWHSEVARLDVIFLTTGAALVLSGWFVSLLENDAGVVLSDCAKPDDGNLVVALHAATEFQYGDPREAPENVREYLSRAIDSVLAIALRETWALYLYESKTGTG